MAAKAICLRLFLQDAAEADSRIFWMAGSNNAIRTPRMAITTSNSISVKPARERKLLMLALPRRWRTKELLPWKAQAVGELIDARCGPRSSPARAGGESFWPRKGTDLKKRWRKEASRPKTGCFDSFRHRFKERNSRKEEPPFA